MAERMQLGFKDDPFYRSEQTAHWPLLSWDDTYSHGLNVGVEFAPAFGGHFLDENGAGGPLDYFEGGLLIDYSVKTEDAGRFNFRLNPSPFPDVADQYPSLADPTMRQRFLHQNRTGFFSIGYSYPFKDPNEKLFNAKDWMVALDQQLEVWIYRYFEAAVKFYKDRYAPAVEELKGRLKPYVDAFPDESDTPEYDVAVAKMKKDVVNDEGLKNAMRNVEGLLHKLWDYAAIFNSMMVRFQNAGFGGIFSPTDYERRLSKVYAEDLWGDEPDWLISFVKGYVDDRIRDTRSAGSSKSGDLPFGGSFITFAPFLNLKRGGMSQGARPLADAIDRLASILAASPLSSKKNANYLEWNIGFIDERIDSYRRHHYTDKDLPTLAEYYERLKIFERLIRAVENEEQIDQTASFDLIEQGEKLGEVLKALVRVEDDYHQEQVGGYVNLASTPSILPMPPTALNPGYDTLAVGTFYTSPGLLGGGDLLANLELEYANPHVNRDVDDRQVRGYTDAGVYSSSNLLLGASGEWPGPFNRFVLSMYARIGLEEKFDSATHAFEAGIGMTRKSRVTSIGKPHMFAIDASGALAVDEEGGAHDEARGSIGFRSWYMPSDKWVFTGAATLYGVMPLGDPYEETNLRNYWEIDQSYPYYDHYVYVRERPYFRHGGWGIDTRTSLQRRIAGVPRNTVFRLGPSFGLNYLSENGGIGFFVGAVLSADVGVSVGEFDDFLTARGDRGVLK